MSISVLLEEARTHKVVDLLPSLLVSESHAIVRLHDAVAGPFPHSAAQVGLVARAHWALRAESLHLRQMSALLLGLQL